MVFRKKHPKVGARPGTLVIPKDAPKPTIHLISYSPSGVTEKEITDAEELRQAFDPNSVTWIDVQGFGDEGLIRKIGSIFHLHDLAVEDIVNVPQRPKVEASDDYLMLIALMVQADGPGKIYSEQISIVLGRHFVLTFQERPDDGDVLDPVRKRIRIGKGPIRHSGAAYLAYAIFDTIIDGYYPVLEQLGNYLDDLEIMVLNDAAHETLSELTRIRNLLTGLRRTIWPLREVANSLVRDPHDLISPELRVYYRDTYDHCIQTSEITEMYRETASGLMNTYLSAIANRTNEIMRVLTIVGTVFIPLTFVAGIYGMNFEFMPELHYRWGYPLAWFIMLGTAIIMVSFFWRKGWIGPRNNSGTRENGADPGSFRSGGSPPRR